MAPSAKTEEENEYEAQRAANIAKNQALLRELQLNASKAGLGISSKSTAKSALSRASTDRSHNKKAAAVKKEKAEIAPRRTSSRLAGLQADSEVAKRKAEEEHAAIQEAARIKRQRISADLDLGDVVVTGKEWDRSRNLLVEAARGKKYERTLKPPSQSRLSNPKTTKKPSLHPNQPSQHSNCTHEQSAPSSSPAPQAPPFYPPRTTPPSTPSIYPPVNLSSYTLP
ncbi:MAG: hypothetical protein M1816_003474 [Peltula sp. TS41687]|nr:MAG: hypothetical protein M1816_003474 [Peltula sp. TS41687]